MLSIHKDTESLSPQPACSSGGQAPPPPRQGQPRGSHGCLLDRRCSRAAALCQRTELVAAEPSARVQPRTPTAATVSEQATPPVHLTLVGIRTGPFTLRFFSLAPLIRSAHTAEKQAHPQLGPHHLGPPKTRQLPLAQNSVHNHHRHSNAILSSPPAGEGAARKK